MINDINIIATDLNANDSRYVIAALNVERVRAFMQMHLGCTGKEIAYALDLSGDQARRAMRKIRAEWKAKKVAS